MQRYKSKQKTFCNTNVQRHLFLEGLLLFVHPKKKGKGGSEAHLFSSMFQLNFFWYFGKEMLQKKKIAYPA